jgi:pyruvate,orthophosphate dikinase
MASTTRWTYFFGNGQADGKGDQKTLLGGKGAGLAEMTRIGLPVPCGFTITTEACAYVSSHAGRWPGGLEPQVRKSLALMEKTCRKKFGDDRDPLLVSVRSGAAASMPGMMETILNLGINDRSVEALAEASGNRRFAFDAYRRLIMMYGSTAKRIERAEFDRAFDELKRTRTSPRLGRWSGNGAQDTDVSAEEFEALVDRFKDIYRRHTGEEFPQDPFEQLRGAIDAVFGSWMAEKAVTYRRVEKITGLAGTAVNVCQMVFGNMGDDSGTGVCFTRDPSTGENIYYGDLLMNAQGEDVVAGVRTPIHLDELQRLMPEAYDRLEAVRVMLEVHYKEMQDLEFTIERGKLYILQCRSGKRSPAATFKIAVEQATAGIVPAEVARRLAQRKYLPKQYVAPASRPIITREQAIRRIRAVDIERLFYPILSPEVTPSELSARRLGEGINAVPGAATGEIAFSADRAEQRAAEGATVILVRHETSPEDVGGMAVASGILTARGGKTSHAAVVARGWGKCCIVGCENLRIDEASGHMQLGGRTIPEGGVITLDGGTGTIYEGRIPLVAPTAPPEYDTLLSWCDRVRRLRVRTNADTPGDAARAVQLGAEGIGLCRTEHMFFDRSQPQRIRAMREMILADGEDARRRALDKLIAFQRGDFEGVFEAMDGKPVTIRLLDPPLHEFLPAAGDEEGLAEVAAEINAPIRDKLAGVEGWDHDLRSSLEARLVSTAEIRRRVEMLHESNPMLGHRGCRLCITFPEILDMQVRAIIEAAINCAARGVDVRPEIMIPLTIDGKELAILIERTRRVAEQVKAERGAKLSYLVGTMIETPRAAVLADRLAECAEFFSFGTNDLTQMTMGLSRDDAGRFLTYYVDPKKAGIFANDPFQTLDVEGVGALMHLAVEQGREERPKIKLGICGEHGGDPDSIRFCEALGLDYVSCSPLRVPVARLAAAQAVLDPMTEGRTSTGRRTGSSRTAKTRVGAGRGRGTAPKGKEAAPRGKSTAKRGTRSMAETTAAGSKKSLRRPRQTAAAKPRGKGTPATGEKPRASETPPAKAPSAPRKKAKRVQRPVPRPSIPTSGRGATPTRQLELVTP